MNADRLIAHYERIADAPDAIARLRRFIIDLAARGKLVPQDSTEESSPHLAEQMRSEKSRLLGSRRMATAVPLNPALIRYGLPKSWVWVALGDVFIYDAGTKREPSQLAPDRWLLELEDIEKDTSRIVQRLLVQDRESLSTKAEFFSGDILYGKLRPYLNKVVGADEPGYCTTEIVVIRPPIPISVRYCCLALRRTDFIEYVERLGRGTKMPRLRTPDAINAPFPLPPLAEQHRIVAKVDELMALCDRLETGRAEREAARDRLAAASLARLNTPDPDQFQADARFALNALPTLTARPDQIKQLRQTILNLAVMGKLVPQNPRDETASKLLERIATDKRDRANSARDRRATSIKTLSGNDLPYPSPRGWIWALFGDVTISRDGERVPISREERDGRGKVYDYYGASGVIDKMDSYLFDKPLLLIGEDGANLINRSTPIAFIARGKYWVNNHAHVLDGLSEAYLRYLELFINATDLRPYVTGTAQPKMNQAKMNSIPIALPPLAEQHRIVAKVDELMALCDRLEASLAAADATRSRLLEALLHDALNGSALAEAA